MNILQKKLDRMLKQRI